MKKLLSFLLLIFALNVFSQKEANFWYFGENAGLDFSVNPPNIINGSLSTDEGSASISDKDGILQFYTDGTIVYNRTGQVMDNGLGLLGDSSSAQSAIIVPKPLDPNIYYIFTVGNQRNGNDGNGVAYSIVDMSLNNGLGEVTEKNVFLVGSQNAREKITSVRGEECNTFWVITADGFNFHSYLINDNGIINVPKTSAHNNNLTNLRGYLKISPDGKTLVNASASSGSYIFDFNSLNGEITNGGAFSGLRNEGYGAEFSRDGQKLYISTGVHSQIINGIRNQTDFASITQFSLESRNIADINASAEVIYQTNSGYRGALQLAPNGKIYYARSRQTFLGVINSPEKEGANAGFVRDGLSLNGQISTEGLPPFIQSFFLEIEIKDQETNTVVNNQDLQYCIGQNKTIEPENISGTRINYLWTFEDGINPLVTISSSATDRNLALTNISLPNKGVYKLKITLKDICNNDIEYNGVFNVDVFEAATATTPEDIIFCDTDRDGFNSFDLQADKNAEILNGLDASLFEVLYFLNLNDANSNENALPNPFTNSTVFSSQSLFARVQNKNATEACFATTNFTLSVTDLPIPTQPLPYIICDDTESGSDTDEKINTFILNTKDLEILGNLDPNQFNISYHTTQIGAENNDVSTVIDKNNNLSVTNSKQVFIRVENKDNTACSDTNKTLDLIVDPLPIVTAISELKQCDTDADKQTTFNLTEAEISISNTSNVNFKYFATEIDAIAGTPEVADKTSYSVDTTGEAWARTITNEGCYRISKIELTVSYTPNEPYQETFISCDDFLDVDGNNTITNSDIDGITNFDFSISSSNITIDTDVVVEFYETEEERTKSINEIQKTQSISNYRNKNIPNTTGNPFPIYYKLISKSNNDCQGLGQIYLQVDKVPNAAPVLDLELCDNANDGNATNGIVQSFNLESQTSTILGNQNPAAYTVSYHDSAANANAGSNSLSSPFENSIRDLQTIYVRVTNNTTGCFTDHTPFNLIVHPLPIANFVEDLEVCDDNTDGSAGNGFSDAIDLESQTVGILGTQDATIYKVTYHRNLIEAQSGINAQTSPFSNTTVNRQTIYVRVFNADTQCANGISNFDVIINPEPTFETISNLSECDNNDDFDDANGIIQTIDLDGKIPEILGASQDPDDFNVTFHASKVNATSGDAPISSPYENLVATETIFVRIQNKKTGCINDDASFDVIVNALPDFTVTTPQILCLNDLPLNSLVENPRAVYTFEWKNANGTILSTDDNINVTTGGTYTVTATTTNGTNCSRTETIVINESNIATLESSFITIIDESNNIGSENNLSISINTIDNDLGPGDYQFAILNTDDNTRTPFAGFQDEPLFENLEGGIYKVIVNDKNGCSPDATLLISVIQFPKFFTPNSDGDNDTWVVKGANKTFYPNSSINIFNRYGKLVAQLAIDGQGWDGTYGGKTLSSDDYWFNITLIPADTTKSAINKKGNFSLIRK
jgi:gliding motility-associated-like protein